jgi:hypothetical protein
MPTSFFKISLVAALLTFHLTSFSSDLKVFGNEFCNPYDAGSCINFHYKKIKDAKNLLGLGGYKYPKGRKAYEECADRMGPTDGALAYCSMIFHREEQTDAERKAMCERSMREKYWSTIQGSYAMGLYDSVWNCNK